MTGGGAEIFPVEDRKMKSVPSNLLAATLVLGLAAALPVHAQQGPSFKLTEHAFNAGGHPANGTFLSSPSFRVSLDAIGDSVAMGGSSGPSFHMEGSFVAAYPPPGEVLSLRFTARDTLVWDAEVSVGVHNLYRDLMGNLSGLGYGACHERDVTGQTAVDGETPSSSNGFFYLVTAENRLGEEGTKGYASDVMERANPAPCP